MPADVRARVRAKVGQKRGTFADGVAGLALELVSLTATLVSFTLLGRQLGPTEYGGLVAMYSLIGIAICLAYVGPGLALLQVGMQKNLDAVARPFFGQQLVLTALTTAVVIAVAPFLVPTVPMGTLALFVIAEMVGTALVTLAANLRIVATGYRSALWLQLLPQVVKVLVIGGLAIAGQLTLARYGFLYMIGSVAVGVSAFVITTRKLGISPRPRALKADHVRATVSMSSTIWAWGLHNDGDKLVMSANHLGADVGLYAAGYRLVQFGLLPVNALSTSSFRSFLDPAGGDHLQRAVRFSIVATVYTTLAALAIIVAAPFALPILVGEGFHASIAMARWLAPVLILRGILTFPGNALLGLGRAHARLVAYMSSAAIGMGMYVWLIPTMSWKGAVIGSYVSDAFLVVVLWTLLIRTARARAHGNAPAPQPLRDPVVIG